MKISIFKFEPWVFCEKEWVKGQTLAVSMGCKYPCILFLSDEKNIVVLVWDGKAGP